MLQRAPLKSPRPTSRVYSVIDPVRSQGARGALRRALLQRDFVSQAQGNALRGATGAQLR